ncbi:MAG: Uma2 family endonuclease [Bacteroidota bacterium]
MEIAVKKKKFTVDDYYSFAEAGIISYDDRLELIHGEIIEMGPHNPRHSVCINRLTMLFASRLVGKAIVSVQLSLTLNNYNEPEPDLVLYKNRDDFYEGERSKPENALLVIEVSNTTLKYDRYVKRELYAQASIPEYWIVDVKNQKLERYTLPKNGEFSKKEIFNKKDTVKLSQMDFTVPPIKVFG